MEWLILSRSVNKHGPHRPFFRAPDMLRICVFYRDWMIHPKHPIRSLLTSILRKANIRYPSDVYTFSFERIKRSNYGEFLSKKCIVYVHDVLSTKTKVNLGTRCSLKMSKNMNKRATENYILF
jgi:hypothetical protein